MADPIGAVALGLHAAHLLITYFGEVQDGPKNRDDFRFELSSTVRILNNIKLAYEETPHEVKERCAQQHEQVFGREGTFKGYLRLLISLNRSLQKKGFTARVRELFGSKRDDESAVIDVENKSEVEALLDSISEGLKVKGQRDKWVFPFRKDDIEADIQRIQKYSDSFHELRAAITHNVNLEALGVAKATREEVGSARTVADRIEAAVRSISGSLDDDKIRSLLDWLSHMDPYNRIQDLAEECRASQPLWVLERPEYQKWISVTDSPQEIWCIGEMGVGKTTLAAFLADYLLQQQALELTGSCVATYFCTFKSENQQTLDAMLRSIARQLIGDDWNTNSKRRDRVALVELLRRKPPGISLLQLMEDLLQGYNQIFMIFDAMDECNVQGELLDCLRKLYKSSPALRVFITSRPMKTIRPDMLQIGVSRDDELIRKCFQSKLDVWINSWTGSDSALARVCKEQKPPKSIVEFVVDSAQGKFLFAGLQWEALKAAYSENDIIQWLDNPTRRIDKHSFDVLFEEAIDRIKAQKNPAQQVLGMRALMWVIHAKRILTSRELLDALSLYSDIPAVDDHGPKAAALMVECTRGLLTLEDNERTVQIHKGFQDYCDGNPEQRRNYFPDADAEIARICMQYLSLPRFNGTHCRNQGEWNERVDKNAFFSYAALRFGDHIKESGENPFLGDEPIFPLREFLLDNSKAAVAGQAILKDRVQGWGGGFFRGDTPGPVFWKEAYESDAVLPALHIAINFKLLKLAERLLQGGMNVDFRAPFGFTPLHMACKLRDAESVAFLLAHGADAAYENRENQPLLQAAAFDGEDRIVQLLLDSRPNMINRQNWADRTALVDAVAQGRNELVKTLLKRGADPRIADRNGNNALLLAARLNRGDIIPDIYQRMNPQIGESSKALAFAVDGHSNDAVKALIDLGADPGHTNWDGVYRTAFHFGVEANNHQGLDIILRKWRGGILRGYGPIVDLISSRNRSPLSIAAERGYVEVVDVLLKHGAFPSANKEWEAMTPLHWAAQSGHANLIGRLLAKNKDLLNLKKHGDRTAISLAAQHGRPDCVDELIKHGADPTIPGAAGNTPLHWAIITGRPRVAQLLTEKCLERYPQLLNYRNDKGESALWLAARTERDERKDLGILLLNAGADPYSVDNNLSLTTLHAAAISGSVELIKAIKAKARDDILDKRINDWNETPLHIAITWNQEASARTLIELGSDLKAVNRQKRTGLLLACARDHVGIVRMLLEKDGDLRSRDIEGATGLHLKARMGGLDTMKMILDRCDPQLLKERDGLGRTAIHLAATGKGPDELKMVLNKYAEFDLLQEVLFWRRKDGLTPSEAAIAEARPLLANMLEERERTFPEESRQSQSIETSWEEVNA